jgi:hypothetical protein
MFKVTKLITLQPEAGASDRQALVDALQSAVRASPQIARSMLQPTLPNVYNGGDYIWHMQFPDEAAYRACVEAVSWREAAGRSLASGPVAHVDSAAYESGAGAVPEPGIAGGVYRTLLLAMRPAMQPEKVAQFEVEMREMPRYVKSITNWGFSRVVEASGARQWTHVWEQDYRDIGGLMGPYMMHPHHWGFIDRWYDPEMTDWIVDRHLCHTFCAFETSVFAPSK